uniref:Transmembrane protein n=1 Tax=Anopheles minimus TaxID=112268 RepID=A0A182W081_9DIPT
MASGSILITVLTVFSLFSLVMSKPFLGDLLARAISSSSTPDDPQSHITDFRMMDKKMDKKADKLQLIDVVKNRTSTMANHTVSEEEEPIQNSTETPTFTTPASTLWQRWNRTDFLARIIDDILKPAQERITLVFQTLVPKEGAANLLREKQVSPNDTRTVSDQQLNSTKDDVSDELSTDLDHLQQESEPALFDPTTNGSTLLGQFQARRNVLRRRVAKALSSITGLLILAANTRKEGNARSTRSIEMSPNEQLGFWAVEQHLPNGIAPYSDHIEAIVEAEDSDRNDATSRRNAESIGIFLLEVFGSMAGFSWGIFKQVQSFFWYAIS